jgi:hypothetical protein
MSDGIHGGYMVRHVDISMEGKIRAIDWSRRGGRMREKKGWAMGKDA